MAPASSNARSDRGLAPEESKEIKEDNMADIEELDSVKSLLHSQTTVLLQAEHLRRRIEESFEVNSSGDPRASQHSVHDLR